MNIQVDEDEEETPEQLIEQKVEAVLEKMWKFNQTYKLLTDKLVIIGNISYKKII